MACEEILLIDDRSSAVSLPEIPLLAVLPGTGGLTRVVDKRQVRRDLADVFATKAEGIRGQQAVDWGLVDYMADSIGPRSAQLTVSPAEVESVLIDHPSVLEAAVVGSGNDDGLETTVAFVVPASGAKIDIDELIAHCRSKMAAFKRPRQIIVTTELPKTATGKIQRFQLRKQLTASG